MKKKNYIVEDLTMEEVKYIRGIIWNSARKYRNKEYKKNEIEGVSIFDLDINQRFLIVEDEYNFLSSILLSDYTKNELELRPYNEEEQDRIVAELDKIAYEAELNKYIEQLTDKEKLVVFLLFFKQYRVNEVAKLLDINRHTVKYRINRIKEKIRREIKKYEK